MEHIGLSDQASVEAVENAHLTKLVDGEKTSMQEFEIEPGAAVPEHEHPHEQIGFLYEGELTFLSDGETVTLSAGDSFVIPGGEPHGVENRGDTVVRGIDVFSPPRTDPDWAE
jgi:quercetin dioxygenase-like cupin family protein